MSEPKPDLEENELKPPSEVLDKTFSIDSWQCRLTQAMASTWIPVQEFSENQIQVRWELSESTKQLCREIILFRRQSHTYRLGLEAIKNLSSSFLTENDRKRLTEVIEFKCQNNPHEVTLRQRERELEAIQAELNKFFR